MRRPMDDHLGAGLKCILQAEVAAVHGGIRRWNLFSRAADGRVARAASRALEDPLRGRA
jgi:hypothetical protein